ncbi:MAG: hypothetical protein KBC12_01375 [Candidatus Pacebacteria bacterium]|nr:hypothetical protein [Candidatus Paceibacterota bacterium]MBP9851460.1 hypothetical protein [Candidatus Paceibacterota bacterium]
MPEDPFKFKSEEQKLVEYLERITSETKHWDTKRFNDILNILARFNGTKAIPARFRPESLHLQNYRPAFDDLLKKTHTTGHEHGRAVLVDTESDKVLLGKTAEGTSGEVSIYATPQKGRERYQRLVGLMHTHPYTEQHKDVAHGFSDQDYLSFLEDPRLQFTTIMYGDSIRLLCLRTSVTPKWDRKTIQRVLTDRMHEFIRSKLVYKPEHLTEFNKIICAEFGLTLYSADKNQNDLFSRMSVVE